MSEDSAMITPHPTPEPGAAANPPAAAESVNDVASAERATQELPPAPSAADILAPPQAPGEVGTLGPYRVVAVVGAGGMGLVFRAADPALGREVALKVMTPGYAADPRARQRFLREARAVAAVEHRHGVPIFHVGEEAGLPFLVMPLLQGESLASALKRDPRPAVAEVVRIGRETAEGLAASHARGLVHRDLKPDNLWLEGPERGVRLLDFGLARVAEAGTDAEPLTSPGALLGTPGDMSPEQARGEALGLASDLFSLGVVLYRLATGVVPFAGPPTVAVLTALAMTDPDPPTRRAPTLPPRLGRLIERLLDKAPTKRPASAAAVAEELRQIEADLAAPPAAQAPRRRGLWWAAAALLLFGGAGHLGVQQIRITTPQGTLVIDTADPHVEVVVRKRGAVLRERTKDREIVLEVGDDTIELAEKNGLKLRTDRFAITHGGKETVTLRHVKTTPPAVGVTPPPPPDLHRKLAEWVLTQDDGAVRLATGEWLSRGAPLPANAIGPGTSYKFAARGPDPIPAEVAAGLTALPADPWMVQEGGRIAVGGVQRQPGLDVHG